MKKRNRTEAYIRGLHTQIKGLKNDLYFERTSKDGIRAQCEEEKQRMRGDLIVNWTPHSYCQTVDGLKLANLKAGDQVAIIGWVTDTKTWLDKDKFGKPCSKANFDIRETRKVSGFLTK